VKFNYGAVLELGITAAPCSLIDYMGRSVRCLTVRQKWFFVKYEKPYPKKMAANRCLGGQVYSTANEVHHSRSKSEIDGNKMRDLGIEQGVTART